MVGSQLTSSAFALTLTSVVFPGFGVPLVGQDAESGDVDDAHGDCLVQSGNKMARRLFGVHEGSAVVDVTDLSSMVGSISEFAAQEYYSRKPTQSEESHSEAEHAARAIEGRNQQPRKNMDAKELADEHNHSVDHDEQPHPEEHQEGSAKSTAPQNSEKHETHFNQGPDSDSQDHAAHESHEAQAHESHDSVSVAISLMLIGTVAFTISLFYLVNFPDEDIQLATWETLSTTISIFCALLIFDSVKDITVQVLGEDAGHHHGPPDTHTLSVAFIRFGVMLALLHAFLALLHKQKRLVKAMSMVGSQIIAFAATDAFGNLQQVEVFRTTAGRALCCAFLVVAILYMRLALGDYLRNRLEDEDWEAIKEHLGEEEEALSLTAGFLVSHVVRFAICGHMAPLHGSPKGKSNSEVCTLFIVACAMCASTFVSETMLRAIPGAQVHRRRAVSVCQEVLTMTMGWCFLACGEWTFWNRTGDEGLGNGDKMTARMLLALVSSALAFLAIFVIDFAQDYDVPGVQPLIRGFILVMALSWEHAFHQAVKGVAVQFEGKDAVFAKIACTVCLCLMVIPAWVWHILPKTKKGNAHHGQSSSG